MPSRDRGARLLYDAAMLKRMAPGRRRQCLAEAAALPHHNPSVELPEWYLQRWHFLPEGYLSRRSVRAYEALVRPFYYAGREGAAIRRVTGMLRREGTARLLELGCGPGRALSAFARGIPSLTALHGVDLSPFMLEAAEARLARARLAARLHHGSATALPFASESFDAVVAMHLPGHLPPEESARTASEAARVLRPGGLLLVVEHRWHRLAPDSLEAGKPEPLSRGLLLIRPYRKRA